MIGTANRSCLEIFADAPDGPELVAYVCEHAPMCRCEQCVVSTFCQDPVEQDETLIRLIVDDTHIKREGGKVRLKSSFLSDVASYGSSTLRLGKATAEEFKIQVQTLLSAGKTKEDGTPREVIGFVRMPVKVIRSLMTEKDNEQKPMVVRSIAAYATGLEDVPHHADVMLNAYHQLSRSGRLRSQTELGKAVQDNFHVINSVDEIYALGASA